MRPATNLQSAILNLIDLALAEDIGPGDVTSEAVLPPDLRLRAHIVAKQAGVVAGLPVAEAVFWRVDPSVRFTPRAEDGARVEAGTVLAEVEGPARSLLAAERTALNFLQRLPQFVQVFDLHLYG